MSNFVTIETDIEPPYVVVNLADWNAMNEALTAESKRAKSAESQRDFFKSRLEELKIELGQCLATDHARFYHLWKIRAEAAERRVAELESQLAATAWRPMDGEDYPRDPNQKIQMIVNGYCVEREEWQTDIGQEIRAPYRCIRGWRPIDPLCPQCDRDMMMEYGALLICVHCGFTYDEAEIQTTANTH